MLQISITIYITFSQGIEKASKERPKREHRDFNPVQAEEQSKEEKIKHISTRKLIGPNEDVYIMDAKSIGNDKSIFEMFDPKNCFLSKECQLDRY